MPCKLLTPFLIFFHASYSNMHVIFFGIRPIEELQDPSNSPRREEVGRRTLGDYGGLLLPFFYRARFRLLAFSGVCLSHRINRPPHRLAAESPGSRSTHGKSVTSVSAGIRGFQKCSEIRVMASNGQRPGDRPSTQNNAACGQGNLIYTQSCRQEIVQIRPRLTSGDLRRVFVDSRSHLEASNDLPESLEIGGPN